MRQLAPLVLATALLTACASNHSPLPSTTHQSLGRVKVTFAVPVQTSRSSSGSRRAEYFSPSTTSLAIALKSVNAAPASAGTVTSIFTLSNICIQSGAYYYCTTTVTVPTGDDILGVLAYSTKPLGTLSGNVPLSFAEGEVQIGGGSTAEPAGAEDITGRLQVTLAPVIYGGQILPGSNAQPNTVPLDLAAFVDAGQNVIPATGFDAFPEFANTPYVSDSDTSGLTYLENASTGQTGQSVAVTSTTDQIELLNTGNEKSGSVSAVISYHASSSNATFTIPSYFHMSGSVSANFTVPPAGSTTDLTYNCTSAGCTKGS